MMWKKIVTIILLLLVTQYSFAMESIVSSLIIDDEDEREIEVVMDKSQMYLPCKYILDFFEIPYKENHAEKSLLFNNNLIKSNGLYIEEKKQPYQVFFIKIDGR